MGGGKAGGVFGSTQGNAGARTFTSKDPYVGETASAIEAHFPGRVTAVNQDIYSADGKKKLVEVDIVLDNTAIQVKSSKAKTLIAQMINTKENMNKTVIGYAPEPKPSSGLIQDAKRKGFRVFTTQNGLLKYLRKNQSK